MRPPDPNWRPVPSAKARHAIACLLLAALTLAVYANTLWHEFVSFDDWFLVEENERIRSLSPASIARMLRAKDPNSHAWLPLRELSYALDYHFWGLVPIGYHLTNVLLHTANALLAYAVLVWLLRSAECGVRRAEWLAMLGAAAFAVHPVQVESVAWVSGRRDVLYAFFFLLSLLAFVAYERGSGRRRRVLYGLSLACLAASLLSKASAMTLPAVLSLNMLVFGEARGERDLWRRMAATVPHWVLALGLTGVHTLVAYDAGIVKGPALGESLANVPLIFAEYARLVFLPAHLVAPHGTSSLRWGTDGARILFLAAVVAAVVAAAWWAAPRRSLAVFCLGWWFLLLVPVVGFVPISVLVAERYLYLPVLGACGLGAAALGSVMTTRWRRGLGIACAVVVVALLSLGAHSRSRVWANSRTFWQDGASKWPWIPVMRIGLATAYVDVADLERAWEQYMMVALKWGRAVSHSQEHVSLVNRGLRRFYDTLAHEREAAGRWAEALEVYETMVRLLQQEKLTTPWVKLARAYERRGMWEKAREAVLAVQKLDASYAGLGEWLCRLEAKAKEKGGKEGQPKGPKE